MMSFTEAKIGQSSFNTENHEILDTQNVRFYHTSKDAVLPNSNDPDKTALLAVWGQLFEVLLA